MPQHDAWRVHGWLVSGARCLVCQFTVVQFTVVQFTVVQFTVHSFSVYGFSVYFYCRFARALSFRAESRNRQALIIASLSTPLVLDSARTDRFGLESRRNEFVFKQTKSNNFYIRKDASCQYLTEVETI